MAYLSLAGMHEVGWVPTGTACCRRPLETMRTILGDTSRAPSALPGFFARRVKPLRHTKHSVWMDEARRHGCALGDMRKPRRWLMALRKKPVPSEGDAARLPYLPQSEFPKVYRGARREKKGIALVCSVCESTETSVWHANRDNKEKPAAPFATADSSLPPVASATYGCGKDGGSTSQMERSKLKKNTWFYESCRKQEDMDIETAAGTTCVKCRMDMTREWTDCKDNPGAKFCTTCYKQNQLDVAAAKGTTCVKCRTYTTLRWVNCKDKPGAKICTTCYQKNLLEVATAAATTCVTSGTDTTSRWVNWKPVPGTKICMACYNKNLRKKKKSAKANDE